MADQPTATERFINGILPENPVYRQLLGLCPTLAVTNGLKAAVTIAGAVVSLAGFWGNLQEAAGAAERIFDLIHHPQRAAGQEPGVEPMTLAELKSRFFE